MMMWNVVVQDLQQTVNNAAVQTALHSLFPRFLPFQLSSVDIYGTDVEGLS